jgi:hypothetical protein
MKGTMHLNIIHNMFRGEEMGVELWYSDDFSEPILILPESNIDIQELKIRLALENSNLEINEIEIEKCGLK